VRVLIVDDEPLARQSLLRHLRAHADFQVVGECGDGPSAVTAILTQQPDLVFLDVQMPEMDGFQVIARIGADRMPAVVFVTAYDRYALRAFDASALDYLLKPFRKERLERALARAREQTAKSPQSTGNARILAALDGLTASRSDWLERIPAPHNGRILFVEAADVEWIESAGNYARLHTSKCAYEIRETLTSLERKLNPKRFVRVHRSTIVNVQQIKEIHPWFHGYHLILLASGKRVRMSRYQREVAERLGVRAWPPP
jgi:two-component system LytT family response regulator